MRVFWNFDIFSRIRASGPYAKLVVAAVVDPLTRLCLQHNCTVIDLTPENFADVLTNRRPDLVFVESAWYGHKESWKYRIAAYPDFPARNNRALVELVQLARDKGIVSIFWNKEDDVHFERFIESAMHFDHIFTVDENCLPLYAQRAQGAKAATLMFAVEPRLHSFTGFNFRYRRANFAGSYSQHVHERRRAWQTMMFEAACSSGLGLTVFDRNSRRRADHYRYPKMPGMEVRRQVAHGDTGRIYRDYLVSLNVNTVENSPTMFSRRLVEIIACGGIAVTAPALAVERLFRDYCHVVTEAGEAEALFSRLQHGPSREDLERARAGADHVAQHHLWTHRLQQIENAIRS